MFRWIAGTLLAAALTASPAAAVDDSRAFEKVKAGDPAYATVLRLERRGYFTGASEGTFSGQRELTRYQFAVAVDKLFRSLQPQVIAATEPGRLPEDLRDLRMLLDAFGADLEALGQDPDEVEKQVIAMTERLSRLSGTARAQSGAARLPEATELLDAAFNRPRSYGVRAALKRPFLQDTLGLRSGGGSGMTASIGPATAELRISPADPLKTAPNMPFADPLAGIGYGAQVNLPVGEDLLVSAFYNREGPLSDRYNLWGPYLPAGGFSGMGGALRGTIGERLALQLETARLRPLDDDPTRTIYVKGGLHYAFSSRLTTELAYEWTKRVGIAGEDFGIAAYVLTVGQKIGPNATLELRYRYFGPGRGSAAGPGLDPGISSAITQFSFRF